MSLPLATLTNHTKVPGRREDVSSTDADAAIASSPAKKQKPDHDTTVLIYELVNDRDVVLQVRPDNTLYDLCKLLCDDWMDNFRGEDCGVESHMWKFTEVSTGKEFEGSPMDDYRVANTPFSKLSSSAVVGSRLALEYDYGTTTEATLKLRSILKDKDLAEHCPGRFQDPQAMSYAKLQEKSILPSPSDLPTLDEKYPNFSKMVFGTGTYAMQPEAVFFFQPGRKQHHSFISAQGYIVWIPERMDTLEELFGAVDKAFSIPMSGAWSWEDRIMYPKNISRAAGAKRLQKLKQEGSRTYVSERVSHADQGYFAKAFPKCHKAYMSKQAAERGWIRYKNGILQVCRGQSETKTSNSPTCFHARDCYDPVEGAVVGKVQHTFTSLQTLLQAAEALWD